MNRARALIVSLAVGLAAIAGVFALGHTLALGKATSPTTDQQVAQRTQKLNRYEASLRKALAQKPPALPAVPRAGGTGSALQVAAGTPTPSVASVRVVYHRPPPVVVIKHRASGETENEHEGAEADD
jgi:hypothetical protein